MSYSNYEVTAPLVIVTDETGAQRYFYEGAVLPQGLDEKRVKALADEGMLGKAKASSEKKSGGSDEPTGKEPTVKEILADVGEDKEKAAAALEAETAKGDDARSSLVEKLQAIASKEE